MSKKCQSLSISVESRVEMQREIFSNKFWFNLAFILHSLARSKINIGVTVLIN
jgi:hypothetical protein